MPAEVAAAPEKPFFDSNIVIYVFARDDYRTEIAERLFLAGGVVGIQTLNEFASIAHRKLHVGWPQIQTWISQICQLCPAPVPITLDLHPKATAIAARYKVSFYDSLMIAAALEASCNILYSEDMQDGQIIEGLTIRSPFKTSTPN